MVYCTQEEYGTSVEVDSKRASGEQTAIAPGNVGSIALHLTPTDSLTAVNVVLHVTIGSCICIIRNHCHHLKWGSCTFSDVNCEWVIDLKDRGIVIDIIHVNVTLCCSEP